MKSPIQRRVAIAALLLAPVLGACGFSAQTDQVYQAAVGVNDRSGNVDILNALVVSGEDGAGTFAGTLVNNRSTEDKLVSVSGDGLTAETKGVTVPADGAADLADAGADDPAVQLAISGAEVKPGNFITLTFEFASGQSTTVTLPVVAQTADYSDVPLPSESSSPAAE